MRKPGHRSASDNRPQARNQRRIREAKIDALRILNNADARKERKHMNDHWFGKHISTDIKGYWTKRGRHPMKGSYGKASRSMARARLALVLKPV